MPLRIARPKPPETQFKRSRAPPPQATKLLLYSLAAGLIFMGTLAVVFVPIYLENANQPVVEVINLSAESGGRLTVSSSNVVLDLTKFNASLQRDGFVIASLAAGLADGGAALRFSDSNGNRGLDAGDYFTLVATVAGSYRFEVWQVDVGRLIGLYAWEGILT